MKIKAKKRLRVLSAALVFVFVFTTVIATTITAEAVAVKPKSIAVSASAKTVDVGSMIKLKVKSVKPSNASKSVTWKTSNKKIATVTNKGIVKGLKEGTVKITATSKVNKKVKKTIKIEVKAVEPATVELNSAKVGDTVLFGSYEQDNKKTNGKEKIEWIVLEKQQNKILVISRYGLDCQPYNDIYENVTWESCTLRSWLNNEFIETAFSKDEQRMVAETIIENADNIVYGTEGGEDTLDKVFLLSVDEVRKYFPTDESRKCKPTEYAKINGVWDEYCFWWLRSPGKYYSSAAEVHGDSGGGVNIDCGGVGSDGSAVRPALWINVE